MTRATRDEIYALAGRARYESEQLGEYVARAESLIRNLQELHPAFSRLVVLSRSETEESPDTYLPVETGPQFGELMVRACFDPESADNYWDLSDEGTLSARSRSSVGFRSMFYAADAHGRKTPLDRCGFELVLVGAPTTEGGRASAAMRIGMGDPSSELADPNLVRQVWMLMLKIWSSDHGFVYRKSFLNRFKQEYGISTAGEWLSYINDGGLVACLPPGIRSTPFLSGAILATTDHIPDVSSAADCEAGRQMCDALEEFGLLRHSHYVRTGWPDEAEERQYAHYVSGAPSDRKYVVNCVAFDGWDPDRKVLLYAKLFRQLKEIPKQWGLRGLDEPVINEARRQVRAAAKAGGVPIEWHIGLEEPARRASYLISEHTEITEHQLKVFYNPMPGMESARGDTQ